MTAGRRRRLLLGGLAGPILFSVVVIAAAALRPGYSHRDDLISELGATGTPRAALMNYAGFVPAGLMLAAFAVGLMRSWPGDRAAAAAALLLTLFGVGIALSGLASCDPGCPRAGSVENTVHDRIAPVTFLSAIAGAGLLGLRFRRWPAWRRLSGYSLLTSALGLVFLAMVAANLESPAFAGLWQRLLVGTLFTWCAVVALHARSAGSRT